MHSEINHLEIKFSVDEMRYELRKFVALKEKELGTQIEKIFTEENFVAGIDKAIKEIIVDEVKRVAILYLRNNPQIVGRLLDKGIEKFISGQ